MVNEGKNFLEVDEKQFEEKLHFMANELEDELMDFLKGSKNAPPRDYKIVTPLPGFCLKTYKINTNEKFFINVCKTTDIPAPQDISAETLTQILQSEEITPFKVPMSVSEPRKSIDKSGQPVDVCDIAIHPNFFDKLEKTTIFKQFFLALISEAISEKYNVQLDMEKSKILANRKFIGTLVKHRVRNDDVEKVINSYENPTEEHLKQLAGLDKKKKQPLLTELSEKEVAAIKAKSNRKEPQYKLHGKLNSIEVVGEIFAEFYLPKCATGKDISLDIGEDRILLESMKHGYLFDKYLNYQMKSDESTALFDQTTRMLEVRIPVRRM